MPRLHLLASLGRHGHLSRANSTLELLGPLLGVQLVIATLGPVAPVPPGGEAALAGERRQHCQWHRRHCQCRRPLELPPAVVAPSPGHARTDPTATARGSSAIGARVASGRALVQSWRPCSCWQSRCPWVCSQTEAGQRLAPSSCQSLADFGAVESRHQVLELEPVVPPVVKPWAQTTSPGLDPIQSHHSPETRSGRLSWGLGGW